MLPVGGTLQEFFATLNPDPPAEMLEAFIDQYDNPAD